MGRFRSTVVVGLASFAVLSAALLARSASPPGPVPNSIQQAYHAGTLTTDSTPIDGYDGELLSLQAVDTGFTAAEPTIGVGPDGVAYFAGSVLDVDRPQTWGVAQTKTLRSTDDGASWQLVQNRVPVTDTSIIPGNADPLIWVDPQTGRVFNLDLYAACSFLNYSDDHGDSWNQSPAACGVPVNDHQTIGAGVARAHQTSGYPTALYYCVNQIVQAACGRSLDGGIVWTPTGSTPYPINTTNPTQCSSLTGHVATDSEGRVFLPSGRCGAPWLAVSEDDGDTWTQVKLSEDVAAADTHTSVAADAAGNLYYVTMADVPAATSKRRLPMLQISRDHGATWSDPINVAPPGVNNVNFPVIAAGDDGRIAINFPGTTSVLETARAPWNQYVVISTDALTGDPTFLSATANDPTVDPVHRGECVGRCGGMWDFIDVQIGPDGAVWAAEVDDCIAACNTGTAGMAHVGEGIAIRQIGGPSLRS